MFCFEAFISCFYSTENQKFLSWRKTPKRCFCVLCQFTSTKLHWDKKKWKKNLMWNRNAMMKHPKRFLNYSSWLFRIQPFKEKDILWLLKNPTLKVTQIIWASTKKETAEKKLTSGCTLRTILLRCPSPEHLWCKNSFEAWWSCAWLSGELLKWQRWQM